MSAPQNFRAGLLAFGLVALLIAAGCNPFQGGPTAETPAPEKPTIAISTPGDDAVQVAGKLVFPRKVELTFGVGGTVGEILVSPGQRVESGDVLATLDDLAVTEYTQRVAQLTLTLDNANEKTGRLSPQPRAAPGEGQAGRCAVRDYRRLGPRPVGRFSNATTTSNWPGQPRQTPPPG